jgi:DNA repair ATPase RecN
MIRSLKIKNFQCHDGLDIQLDPKITTIVGPSDIGKSAIHRAIRWLSLNSPSGDGFIKNGTEEVCVHVSVENKVVKRSKGKENLYGIDGKDFKSFGTSVPDDIKQVLNVNEINFQNQLEGPFWLSLSAGEVSRQLNDIVDLGIIDQSLSSVSKRIRAVKERVKIFRESLTKAKQQREDLKWVVEADKHYKYLEYKQQSLSKLALSSAALAALVVQCKGLQNKTATATARGQAAATVYKLARQCKQYQERSSQLSSLINTIKDTQIKINTKLPDLKPVHDAYSAYNEITIRVSVLNQILKKARIESKTLKDLIVRREEAKEALEIGTEGLCPICGNKINA